MAGPGLSPKNMEEILPGPKFWKEASFRNGFLMTGAPEEVNAPCEGPKTVLRIPPETSLTQQPSPYSHSCVGPPPREAAWAICPEQCKA